MLNCVEEVIDEVFKCLTEMLFFYNVYVKYLNLCLIKKVDMLFWDCFGTLDMLKQISMDCAPCDEAN